METPTPDRVERLFADLGVVADDAVVEAVTDQFAAQIDALEPLTGPDLASDPAPDREWTRPTDEDDPLGAFLARCRLGGDGPLDDLRVAVKDNIAVAGMPMTCGAPLLEDYEPATDATVVRRLLDEGAVVVGKTNMDEFAFGGDRSTMRLRLARNPHDPERQPGSSSAGSGVAVATGAADAALGSDTGGSVRFPAAWCGVVGVKPSRGRVSHHGFVQYAKTLDTVGVLARDVSTARRVLAAIAGPDPHDERTLRRDPPGGDLVDRRVALDDIRIGRPEQLFGNAPDLDAVVEERLDDLAEAGATVEPVTVPDYDYWLPAWLGLGTIELSRYLDADGTNTWALDPGAPGFADAMRRATDAADELGDPVVSAWALGRYLSDSAGDALYARAHEARRRLADGIDAALADVDVLASTTVPMLPPKWGEGIDDVFGALSNTGPFNVAGHPAVSIPVGSLDGLPVCCQFVARRGADATALAVAETVETALAAESTDD
jgi:Asp-tRNA(Asn)/Glu-tRNA(Gln) amidotransferase A subunit family amidase